MTKNITIKALIFTYIGLGYTYTLILAAAMFIPNFLLELLISYLPQILYFNIAVILLNAFISLFIRKQGRGVLAMWTGANVLFIGITILAAGFIYQFAYQMPEIDSRAGEKRESRGVKIVSFNKLYTNQNHSQIDTAIRKENPDILAIIEQTDTDKQNLTILKEYKYKADGGSKVYSGKRVGVSIYSKLPLDDIKANPVDGLSNIEAKVDPDSEREGDEFVVLALHTAAPVTPKRFSNRSNQLDNLADYLNNHEQKERMVIMGDFNLTPWSPEYREFSSKVPGIYNSAAGEGLKYTWDVSKYSKLPVTNLVITNHIDHILLSDSLDLKRSLTVGEKAGSDHSIVNVIIEP